MQVMALQFNIGQFCCADAGALARQSWQPHLIISLHDINSMPHEDSVMTYGQAPQPLTDQYS